MQYIKHICYGEAYFCTCIGGGVGVCVWGGGGISGCGNSRMYAYNVKIIHDINYDVLNKALFVPVVSNP